MSRVKLAWIAGVAVLGCAVLVVFVVAWVLTRPPPTLEEWVRDHMPPGGRVVHTSEYARHWFVGYRTASDDLETWVVHLEEERGTSGSAQSLDVDESRPSEPLVSWFELFSNAMHCDRMITVPGVEPRLISWHANETFGQAEEPAWTYSVKIDWR